MAAPTIRATTAPAPGLASTSPASTQVGDLVIVMTWERVGAGIPTHTLESGFTEVLSHGHDDGSTDGRLSTAAKVATSSGASSYQAYTTNSGLTDYWTGILVLEAGTFADFAAFLTASNTQTNNAVPNPVAVTGLDAGRDYLVLAIAAWHLGSAGFLTPTAPTNYTLETHVATSALGDIALATRDMTGAGVTSEDPAAYGDNLTPNGTATMTIAIPAAAAAAEHFGEAMMDIGLDAAVPAAQVEMFGTASLDIGVGPTSEGTRETFSSATMDIAFGMAADGTVSTGATEHFGAATLDIGIGISTAGTRETFGTAAMDVAVAGASDGTRQTFSTAAMDVAVTFAADGVVTTGPQELFGSATLDIGIGIAADGVVEGGPETHFGAATMNIGVDVGAAAFAELFGTAALDIAIEATAAPVGLIVPRILSETGPTVGGPGGSIVWVVSETGPSI